MEFPQASFKKMSQLPNQYSVLTKTVFYCNAWLNK